MIECLHLNEIVKRIVREIRFVGCVRTIEGLLIKCEDCGNERELTRDIKVERTIQGIRV